MAAPRPFEFGIERDGFLTRHVFPTNLPSVEYRLTPFHCGIRGFGCGLLFNAAVLQIKFSSRAEKQQEPIFILRFA